MSMKNPSASTHLHSFSSIIRNCLQGIHDIPARSHTPFLPKRPSVLATNLIKAYFEKGSLREARKLFDEMIERDVVTWTAMISGYTFCNEYFCAWCIFCNMAKSEVKANAFTLSGVLKACKGMKDNQSGALVHGLAVKSGMEGFIYVGNGLVDMYAACADMRSAYMVFCGIEEKNVVSWTTLIAGFTHAGLGYSAIHVFRQMLLEEENVSPYIFSISVRACASIGSESYGRQLHTSIVKHGFASNLPVSNSIIDMYCRCGHVHKAEQYFSEMNQKDLITWNTLIAGHERLDAFQSLRVFREMERQGFSPNCFSHTSIVAACANLAALSCGRQVHGGIIRRGNVGNVALDNALVDMYAKCGGIADARQIFCEMPNRDLVSWTSMLIGYGAHGCGAEAAALFDQMVQSGIKPDQVAYMAVLGACSHAGMVDRGLDYFSSMVRHHKITPSQGAYGCVVDLLGRAGKVEEAHRLIQSMPFKPDESVWGALLGACRAHSLPKLGKFAAMRVLDLRPSLAEAYVLLANIYAAESNWREFATTRKLMKRIGSKKEAGRSWIEVRNQVCSFIVGDKEASHVECVLLLKLLLGHMKELGYVAEIDELGE